MIASNRNALSLCADDRYFYVGHPWGVAVYQHSGRSEGCIALGTSAVALAKLGDTLYAGTRDGLFAIGPLQYTNTNKLFEPPRCTVQRIGEPFAVLALAAKDEQLWIGTGDGVRRYSPKTREMRVFSPRELTGKDQANRYTRFLFDGPYVWVDGGNGAVRYDPKTGQWKAPAPLMPNNPVGLIGMIGGALWGHLWVDETLRDRPCLIDRETLVVKPVLIEGLDKPAQSINGPFAFFGRRQDKPVFGGGYPAFFFDAGAGVLRPLPEANQRDGWVMGDVPVGLLSGHIWRRPDGALECYDDITGHHTVWGRPFGTQRWTLLTLQNGATVLAGAHERESLYQNPYEDETEANGGVLLCLDGNTTDLTDEDRRDTLRGDEVFSLLADGDRRWLCTSHGLAVLDKSGRLTDAFSRREGLSANTVMNGVALGGKLYFATRWGDNGGGLAIFDPATNTFSSRTDADGLAANSLQAVAADGDALKLTYGIQYRRFADGKYQQYPAGRFKPETGEVTPPGTPLISNQTKIITEGWAAAADAMPYLGGAVYGRETAGGKTYFYGSRGLVIMPENAPAVPAFPVQAVTVIRDPQEALKDDARRRPANITKPEELRQALQDPNPLFRAKALSSFYGNSANKPELWRAAFPIIATQLDSPEYRVRATALYLALLGGDDQALIPLLTARLNDDEVAIRELAAMELARRGKPDYPHLHAIFQQITRRGGEHSLPFGADSTIGILVDLPRMYGALAPHADVETFRLMMDFPLSARTYGLPPEIFRALGIHVNRSKDIAELLLHAHGEAQVQFARDVYNFAFSDSSTRPDVLQSVMEAGLKSPDRVVRSNAARAYGTLGDPTAIPKLMAALDLESGLSRASIVWALGELKAKEALPRLAQLYVDAANDDRRRQGVLIAQQQAAIHAQYTQLSSLDAVGADWDELKTAANPPASPLEGEILLTPAIILEAVRNIGPAASQAFYRGLAGAKDDNARREAAKALAEGALADMKENIPILQNLLGDRNQGIGLAAAVSLVHIGRSLTLSTDPAIAARAMLLDALNGQERWERMPALRELTRLRLPEMEFARARIGAIAKDATAGDEERQIAAGLLR